MTTLPKLALIPSGYKASKVYSPLPTNGDGDFTFSRTSNATRVNKDGLIESVGSNVPRLDYLDSNCPSLLLEPQRRNLFLNSEDFTSWSKIRTTITGNQSIAPDGSNNADLLTGDGTGTSYVYDDVFLYTANYYISVFVKNINGDDFTIQNFTQAGVVTFDLTNGTVTSVSGTMSEAKIKQYSNNWYRVSAKITSTLGGATANLGFGVKNYNGDQFYIWGAQIEDNGLGGSVSYLSSYIPTTSSQKTRIIEYVSNSYTGLTNTNGTIFIELETKNVDINFSKIIALRDTVTGESLRLEGFESGGVKKISFFGINGVLSTPPNADTLPVNTRKKIALTFKDGNFKYASDGVITTGTYSGTARKYNQIGGANITGGAMHNSVIYQLMVFDEVLSDAELISLTT